MTRELWPEQTNIKRFEGLKGHQAHTAQWKSVLIDEKLFQSTQRILTRFFLRCMLIQHKIDTIHLSNLQYSHTVRTLKNSKHQNPCIFLGLKDMNVWKKPFICQINSKLIFYKCLWACLKPKMDKKKWIFIVSDVVVCCCWSCCCCDRVKCPLNLTRCLHSSHFLSQPRPSLPSFDLIRFTATVRLEVIYVDGKLVLLIAAQIRVAHKVQRVFMMTGARCHKV